MLRDLHTFVGSLVEMRGAQSKTLLDVRQLHQITEAGALLEGSDEAHSYQLAKLDGVLGGHTLQHLL